MPTLCKPQLTDVATPWLEIWERMDAGLQSRAREILSVLNFYAERDLEVPSAEVALTLEEKEELALVSTVLTYAAVESQKMKEGVLVATLSKITKEPDLFSLKDTPAAVQWEIARDYRSGDEAPGTYVMDLWGSPETAVPYIWGEPTAENISRAAEAALKRKEEGRTVGRAPNLANVVLAERLGEMFRHSGQRIVRRHEKQVRNDECVHVENGPFYEFLRMVLPPLSEFLREHSLPPVTIETIVRLAIEAERP